MSALVVPEHYFGPTRGVMGRIAVSLSGQWFLAAALTVLIVVDYPKVWAEAGPGLDGAEVGDAVVTGADLGPNLASVVSLAMALTSERRLDWTARGHGYDSSRFMPKRWCAGVADVKPGNAMGKRLTLNNR